MWIVIEKCRIGIEGLRIKNYDSRIEAITEYEISKAIYLSDYFNEEKYYDESKAECIDEERIEDERFESYVQ